MREAKGDQQCRKSLVRAKAKGEHHIAQHPSDATDGRARKKAHSRAGNGGNGIELLKRLRT